MKLWLLKSREDLDLNDDPWEPWYDKAFGHVVAAETEQQARQMVIDAKATGDEVSGTTLDKAAGPQAWLNARYSTCEEIGISNRYEARVILTDFHSA